MKPTLGSRLGGLIRLAAPGLLVFLIVETLLTTTVWMTGFGDFAGPDSYMRLVRVLECKGGWGCPDGLLMRSNVPYGEILHWPFLMDRLILALSAPFVPFVGFADSVVLAGHLVGPLMGLLGMVFLTAMGREFLPSASVPWVGVLAAAQYWFLFAFAPVRPDHHGIQLIAFLIAVLGLFYLLNPDSSGKGRVLAGLGIGVALWVSTEAMVSLTPLILVPVGVWVFQGGNRLPEELADALFLATAILLLGLLVDGPEPDPFAVEFDRFSLVHVAGLLLPAVFLRLTAARPPRSEFGRAATACVGIGLVGLLLMWFFPGIQRGPTGAMDPALQSLWLDYNYESYSGVRLGLLPWGLIALGPGIVALVPAFGKALSRVGRPAMPDSVSGGSARSLSWVMLSVALTWFLLLGLLFQIRWAHYLHLLAPIGLAFLLHQTLFAWRNMQCVPLARAAGVVVTVLIFLLWPIPVLLASGGVPQAPGPAAAACSVGGAASAIRAWEAQEKRPARVLTPVFWGPEILFRTDASIVAGPYHRNSSGILDSHRIMASTEPGKALSLLDERGIDLVILCSTADWMPFVSKDAVGTLYEDLVTGAPPPGLEPIPRTTPVSPLRVYRRAHSNDPNE